jgi:hypothetical protein
VPATERIGKEYPPAPPLSGDEPNGSAAPEPSEGTDEDRQARRGFGVPYIAPELPPLPDGLDDPNLPANRPRARLRERP